MKRAALVALLRDLEVSPHVLREAADELEASPANDARPVPLPTPKATRKPRALRPGPVAGETDEMLRAKARASLARLGYRER